ncbi:MAG: hypothetical protein ACRDKL_06235 [Solirubrobacteraceae bacterium]
MAQTKRKRQTKHRGNAAGMIETRGRTGRPLSADERKKQDRVKAREARLNRAPTWRGSAQRALLAGTFMFLFLLFVNHPKNHSSPLVTAILFGVVATVIYTPGGYYMELFLYRRRMAKKQQR